MPMLGMTGIDSFNEDKIARGRPALLTLTDQREDTPTRSDAGGWRHF